MIPWFAFPRLARLICFFAGHDWELTSDSDVNMRERCCLRCERQQISIFLQPWKDV